MECVSSGRRGVSLDGLGLNQFYQVMQKWCVHFDKREGSHHELIFKDDDVEHNQL